MVLKKQQQQIIVVPTHTIVHPCLDVMAVIEVQYMPKCFFIITQQNKNIQGYNICLTESDNDYILDKIKWRGKIEYERNINVENYVE